MFCTQNGPCSGQQGVMIMPGLHSIYVEQVTPGGVIRVDFRLQIYDSGYKELTEAC